MLSTIVVLVVSTFDLQVSHTLHNAVQFEYTQTGGTGNLHGT